MKPLTPLQQFLGREKPQVSALQGAAAQWVLLFASLTETGGEDVPTRAPGTELTHTTGPGKEAALPVPV